MMENTYDVRAFGTKENITEIFYFRCTNRVQGLSEYFTILPLKYKIWGCMEYLRIYGIAGYPSPIPYNLGWTGISPVKIKVK